MTSVCRKNRTWTPAFACGLARLIALVLALVAALSAQAGVMTKESMLLAFPSPIIVGDKDTALPIWPLFKQDATATPLIGYVFESIDLAPIPGFSGTPFNLLIALDANGEFMEVRVLSQHEPVFLDGLGVEPLFRFVEQYKSLSLKQNIKIGAGKNNAGDANVYIHGVAKATASVLVVFAGFCVVAAVWRHLWQPVPPPVTDVRPIPRMLLLPMNAFLLLVALAALVGIWVG